MCNSLTRSLENGQHLMKRYGENICLLKISDDTFVKDKGPGFGMSMMITATGTAVPVSVHCRRQHDLILLVESDRYIDSHIC